MSLYLKKIETLTIVKGSLTVSQLSPGFDLHDVDLLIDQQELFGGLRIGHDLLSGTFKVSGLQRLPNLYRLRLNCCPADTWTWGSLSSRKICLVIEETHELDDRLIEVEQLVTDPDTLNWAFSLVEIGPALPQLKTLKFLEDRCESEYATDDILDIIADHLDLIEEEATTPEADLSRLERLTDLTLETATSCGTLLEVLSFFRQLETLRITLQKDGKGEATAAGSLLEYLRSSASILKLKHVNISGAGIEWLVHFRQCETVHLTCFGPVEELFLWEEWDRLDDRAGEPSKLKTLHLDLRSITPLVEPKTLIDFIKRQIKDSTEISVSGNGIPHDSTAGWTEKIMVREEVLRKAQETKRNISSNP